MLSPTRTPNILWQKVAMPTHSIEGSATSLKSRRSSQKSFKILKSLPQNIPCSSVMFSILYVM